MLFDKNVFVVKERVAFLKLTDTYDILDAESGVVTGIAREIRPTWAKLLRLLVSKTLLPTVVEVREGEGENGQLVVVLRKGFGILTHKVSLEDNAGRVLNQLASKLFSLGGGFKVNSPDGQQVADMKGDWKGWNFTLTEYHGQEIGRVTKKWAGLGKELFTSADNYIVETSTGFTGNKEKKRLLLASSLALDIIFKERK